MQPVAGEGEGSKGGGEMSVTGCAAPEGGHSYRSPGGRGRGPGCRGRGQSIRHAEYFFSGCRHFHALRGGAGRAGNTRQDSGDGWRDTA